MDPDVWLHPAIKENWTEYYEYIFVYIDDILVLSEEPHNITNMMEVFIDWRKAVSWNHQPT